MAGGERKAGGVPLRKGIAALLGLTLVAALAALGVQPAGGTEPAERAPGSGENSRLRLKTIAERLRAPVFVARAPGRANRDLLFVVEQRGLVRVVKHGKVLQRPFLDLRDRVSEGAERGLLSIAFDPGYVENRLFYAYYTDSEGDIRVSQFRRSRSSRVLAFPRDRDVIEIPHADRLGHNGGTVTFGPDGMLYMATGDGGSACDPEENAQNPGSLLGKLLRIETLNKGGYRSPVDNPFADSVGGRSEIYAVGLRNPFRFSFDGPTGTIAIGDVGQFAWEEVDYESLEDARGANFGWDALEGTHPLELAPASACEGDTSTPIPDPVEPPILEYPHVGRGLTGCAVTGGIVVRDPALNRLQGRYLFADHCRGPLRSFVPAQGGAGPLRELKVEAPGVTSFLSGRKGRVFITTITGELLRLRG
jgi:glucose/arabinose dehydrogenase